MISSKLSNVHKIEEKEGVVVLLDRLGTKGIWKDDAVKVIEEWDNLIYSFNHMVKELTEYKYKITTFSDTIAITATADKNQYLENLIIDVGITCGIILALGMAKNAFFRGGISVGKFFDYKQTIMGPAIDELAQYYTLAEWIGISASPSAHRLVNETVQKNVDLGKIFYKYDIPLKNSIERDAWAINWPQFQNAFFDMVKQKNVPINYKSFDEIINEQLKNTTDISISLKWRNTNNFAQRIIQENKSTIKQPNSSSK